MVNSDEPPILAIELPEAIAAAVEALQQGEIIAYPTDTLYGVGGDALSPAAAQRVHEAKGREAGKGFPVLLASSDQVPQLARSWPEVAEQLAARFWPGALTIVVPSRPEVPELVRTGATVALRVPGYAPIRQVIAQAGRPLIGTSANRSGRPPALTAVEAARELGRSVRLVLDGGRVGGAPSTVVAIEGAAVRLIRAGAVSRSALEAVLAGLEVPLLPAEPPTG